MDYSADGGTMVFVQGDGLANLIIQQANVTISGNVECMKEEECKGMTIILEQKGIADMPDRWRTTTILKEDNTFVFSDVPNMNLIVRMEQRGQCWHRQIQAVDMTTLKGTPSPLKFHSRGY